MSNTKFRIKFRHENLPTARCLDMKKAKKASEKPNSCNRVSLGEIVP